jgi:hypothetical protein
VVLNQENNFYPHSLSYLNFKFTEIVSIIEGKIFFDVAMFLICAIFFIFEFFINDFNIYLLNSNPINYCKHLTKLLNLLNFAY